MISTSHLVSLRIIYDKLIKLRLDWSITGSLGFALHGMDVPVNDIDIQTDADSAYKIEDALLEYVVKEVKFSESGNIRSHFGELCIRGIKVEIMGGLQKRLPGGTWEDSVDVTLYRKFVKYKDMSLPVLSLEYEQIAYRNLGRVEKADMIKTWLEKNESNKSA